MLCTGWLCHWRLPRWTGCPSARRRQWVRSCPTSIATSRPSGRAPAPRAVRDVGASSSRSLFIRSRAATAIVLSLLVVHYAAPGIAFGVAYLSHLIADALTVQGVPLAWPVSHKNINLLPRALRERTGSWAEYALMGAMG